MKLFQQSATIIFGLFIFLFAKLLLPGNGKIALWFLNHS